VRDYPFHQGVERLVRDLNGLYRSEPALHALDFDGQGFEWIDCHDAQNSVLVYLRRTGEDFVVVALNFTPVPRETHRIGVPVAGTYREILNSDASEYAGSGMGNAARTLQTDERPWMHRPYSIELCLPPLAGIVLKLQPQAIQSSEAESPEVTTETATQ
jgi:1,4-alpha-glucan branching enzyme